MNKKKILFVLNNFNIGGPQKSLLSLMYEMDPDKYEVHFISLDGVGELTNYLPSFVVNLKVSDIISFATLNPKIVKQKIIRNLLSKYFRIVLKAVPYIIKGKLVGSMVVQKQKYWNEIKKYLPTIDDSYDVAIGVSGGHSMMFITDCIDAKKKIGWIRTDYRVLNRNHDIDKVYFEKMDEIISVSEICKNIFLEIFPETEQKLHVMYNILPYKMYDNLPADTSLMNQFKNELKLITICRLDPNKGLDLAIQAMRILKDKGYIMKWFILGDGPYGKKLKSLIKENNLEQDMILLGSHINTAKFIEKADIVIHPSRFEGKSNVIDEAKHLNKPIVATRFNTVEEQITNLKTGLIAELSASSLANAIERYISDSTIKNKIIKNLQELSADDNNFFVFEEIIQKE